MMKRVFFIILILFLNSFDIVKSEEFLSCSHLKLEKDFTMVTNDCSCESIKQENWRATYLAKPLQIESDKNEKSIPFVKSNTDEEFNADKIKLAAAGTTTATLGIFSPLLLKSEKGGIWFRPYTTFESVPLKNGPTVKNISYGSLLGFDSDPKNLKNNWQVVKSGYLGYTGSEQSFDHVKRTNISGYGGAYSTFYKDNFFSAVVLTAGTNVAKSNDSEDITGIHAGIITRTGYNIKLPHHIVFQPNYIMSYTFDNTFDYKNNRGESVRESPLNIIHIVPSAIFFANLKDGWQPFIILNMNFNILASGEVTVNNSTLPTVSVNPYIEYGGGVQKNWDGKYSAFVQTLARSGGRNGITFLLGFRYAFN